MGRLAPIHPGEILREEYLKPMSMSVNKLAMALRIPTPRLNDICREKRAITPSTALRLAAYFDTTPEFWLGLQMKYDLAVAADRELKRIK